MKKTYGINSHEYYDLIMYGGCDSETHPKCQYCGKPLKFKNLSNGYSYYKNCGEPECKSRSYSDSRKIILKKLSESGIHPWMNSSPKRDSINKNTSKSNHLRALNNNHPCQNTFINIHMQKMNFINRGNFDDHAIYYFAKCKDKNVFKLEVTTNPDARIALSYGNILSIHEIKSGTRIEMAELESKVKLYFNSKSEYFKIERFKEVALYIKSII